MDWKIQFAGYLRKLEYYLQPKLTQLSRPTRFYTSLHNGFRERELTETVVAALQDLLLESCAHNLAKFAGFIKLCVLVQLKRHETRIQDLAGCLFHAPDVLSFFKCVACFEHRKHWCILDHVRGFHSYWWLKFHRVSCRLRDTWKPRNGSCSRGSGLRVLTITRGMTFVKSFSAIGFCKAFKLNSQFS